MARVAFLGTPELAVPFLERLAAEHSVTGVVTRPDAARGRSGRPQPSPVAAAALRLGLPIARPERADDLAAALAGFGPLDIGVVVAYGSLIRPDALSVPSAGHLNVHFSILPHWRGAAPVQRAILAGDRITGVTVMRLDEGLDTGPYLAVTALRVLEDQTAGDLFQVLIPAGLRLLSQTIDRVAAGNAVEVPQPLQGSLAPKITRAETRLSVVDPAFVAKVRAFSPRPGAWIEHDGARLRILRARRLSDSLDDGELVLDGDTLVCGVAGAAVELVEVQPSGGRPMSGSAWARGRRGRLGTLV